MSKGALNKNVIVTGGAGYIGSHACKALAKSGYLPISYDNLCRGNKWAVKWGPLEIGDILNSDQLAAVFFKYRPCAVMHFAALAYVGESVEQPMDYYRNNFIGSHNLLGCMLSHGINKFIFSSTCSIYGTPIKIPITETHKKEPINPYGYSKLAVEGLLSNLSEIDKLKFVSLRYFNAAGADPEGEIGEGHDPETHLIPLILQAAAETRTHIDVYGNDYDTRDGTCIRDYLHVADLVSAHMMALEYLLNGGKSNFYNLGTEKGYSVQEIISRATQITGKEIVSRIVPRRSGDPAMLVADSSKIRQEFGWTLENSDLNSILSSAWNWHQKNPV